MVHEIGSIPQDANDFVWWGFNLLLLIVVWFMKRDLGEIKADTKAARVIAEANAAELMAHKAVCHERHQRMDYEIAEIKSKGAHR